jgi:hypothetical protein
MKLPRPSAESTPLPWRGEVHDALFTSRDLRHSKDKGLASLTFWRPAGGSWQRWSGKKNEDILWESLTVTVRGADALDVMIREKHPCYELSTVYFDASQSRVVFESHYGIDVAVRGRNLKIDITGLPSAPTTWRHAFEDEENA